MKGLVGQSNCESITYSRLLRVDQVAPLVFEPVNCRFRSRHASHSATATHTRSATQVNLPVFSSDHSTNTHYIYLERIKSRVKLIIFIKLTKYSCFSLNCFHEYDYKLNFCSYLETNCEMASASPWELQRPRSFFHKDLCVDSQLWDEADTHLDVQVTLVEHFHVEFCKFKNK